MALNSRTLLNLGLLLLCGILVLLVIYEPGIEPPPEAPAITSLDRDAVREIRIERSGRTTVRFERTDAGWRMREPIDVPAADFPVNSLVGIATARSQASYAVDALDLGRYGLGEPKVSITFNNNISLAFGEQGPLGERRYVRAGETVHLIDETHFYRLTTGYASFISPRLLEQGVWLEKLALPGIRLRREQGQWQADPAPGNLSADPVAALVDAWRHASAIEVQEYDGKEGEEVTITLEGREAPIRFLLTARSPDLVLARPDLGIQYLLPPSASGDLLTLRPQPDSTEAGAPPQAGTGAEESTP